MTKTTEEKLLLLLERLDERRDRPQGTPVISAPCPVAPPVTIGGARTETIGIFALLIGMLIQTGAGFFWAGGMSKSYDALDKSIVELKTQQVYQSAQLQVLDGSMKKAEGKAEASEKAAEKFRQTGR